MKYIGLQSECIAIGSLPHRNIAEAMALIENYFCKIPFWPQLSNLSKNENMTMQFLDNMPGIVLDEACSHVRIGFETEKSFKDLECFFVDYEDITSGKDIEKVENYAISSDSAQAFSPFIKLVKKLKPQYAKGQVVGPFTLSTSIYDNDGYCAYYDETLRDVIVKTLSLKAIWQIYKIRQASPTTTPIIFIDEPSLTQLGTSVYITVSSDEVVEIIKEVSDVIKAHGALSALHCCGKCDWELVIKSSVDIINFDAFLCSENMSLFHKQIQNFLENGGKIACGIVPTLDKVALDRINQDELIEQFDSTINLLSGNESAKKLLMENVIITPSCGAGSLSVELAEKAMMLTWQLSQKLKER